MVLIVPNIDYIWEFKTVFQMKRISSLIILSGIVLLGMTSCRLHGIKSVHDSETDSPEEAVRDTIPPLGFRTEDFMEEEGSVRSGQTFSSLLSGVGLSGPEIYGLLSASDSVFDVKRLKAGNPYHTYYTLDSLQRARYLVYEESRTESVVFDFDSLRAWRVSRPVERILRYNDVTIKSSLWNDMRAAGASPLLVMDLSDIYAWTVDFFTLRDGDRFKVMYTEKRCEGEFIGIDTIYFADFIRDEKSLPAIMFDQGDKGNLYWSDTGESLRKAFLKAPLEYKRISSGFSYHRLHPVHHVVRAHTGVDYAAPTGTPVRSIGDGTVISVGWGGGGGNTVKIRHNSVYTTAYLHLSRYAKGLKAGQRVRQGEVIGYVGMTGTATGPHLDFRVWKNGTPINPLTMESPAADPLKPEFKKAFDSTYVHYRHVMDSLSRL